MTQGNILVSRTTACLKPRAFCAPASRPSDRGDTTYVAQISQSASFILFQPLTCCLFEPNQKNTSVYIKTPFATLQQASRYCLRSFLKMLTFYSQVPATTNSDHPSPPHSTLNAQRSTKIPPAPFAPRSAASLALATTRRLSSPQQSE